ncbi:hypothetical protein BJX62DRAFT_207152 [Aspergillus germanicus]
MRLIHLPFRIISSVLLLKYLFLPWSSVLRPKMSHRLLENCPATVVFTVLYSAPSLGLQFREISACSVGLFTLHLILVLCSYRISTI